MSPWAARMRYAKIGGAAVAGGAILAVTGGSAELVTFFHYCTWADKPALAVVTKAVTDLKGTADVAATPNPTMGAPCRRAGSPGRTVTDLESTADVAATPDPTMGAPCRRVGSPGACGGGGNGDDRCRRRRGRHGSGCGHGGQLCGHGRSFWRHRRTRCWRPHVSSPW